MTLRVIARDDFPVLTVAFWAMRAEAHETIMPACRIEAAKSGLFRLRTIADSAVNANERRPQLRSVATS
jgi:hypothetical protein